MGTRNRYQGIDSYALWLIRYKVKRLVGRFGITEADCEDLEQEIMLGLLRRLPKYDPRRAQLDTFISRVVEHKISTIIERQKAAKRDYRLCAVSLNDDMEAADGDILERSDTIDCDVYLFHTGRISRPSAELKDLQIDVNWLLDRLPDDLKTLCENLKSYTVTETSRKSKMSRTLIYRKLKQIRAVITAAGLHRYLCGERDSFDDFPVCINQSPEASGKPEATQTDEPLEQSTTAGEGFMNNNLIKYSFSARLDMKDVEESLMLAIFAIECLHNRSRVMLDVNFSLSPEKRSCVINATTEIGRDIAVLFTGFLRREFGESEFELTKTLVAFRATPEHSGGEIPEKNGDT